MTELIEYCVLCGCSREASTYFYHFKYTNSLTNRKELLATCHECGIKQEVSNLFQSLFLCDVCGNRGPSSYNHRFEYINLKRTDVTVCCSMICNGLMVEYIKSLRKNPEIEIKVICRNCKKYTTKMLKCSRCKNAHYCDFNCQKSDWINHKQVCLKN